MHLGSQCQHSDCTTESQRVDEEDSNKSKNRKVWLCSVLHLIDRSFISVHLFPSCQWNVLYCLCRLSCVNSGFQDAYKVHNRKVTYVQSLPEELWPDSIGCYYWNSKPQHNAQKPQRLTGSRLHFLGSTSRMVIHGELSNQI